MTICRPSAEIFISRFFLILVLWFLLVPASLCQSARQVTLTWNANSEPTLSGYRVFCRPTGASYNYNHPAWEGPNTFCVLTGLNEHTDYAFVVRAYDIYGNESANSDEVWMRALYPETVDPATPALVAPQNGATRLFLSPVLQTSPFFSSSSTDQHLRTQWRISRVTPDGSERIVLDMTSETHLTELDVPPLVLDENTMYQWAVRYYGTLGTYSGWSSPFIFTTGLFTSENASTTTENNINGGHTRPATDPSEGGDNQREWLQSVTGINGVGLITLRIEKESGILAIAAVEPTDPVIFGDPATLPFEMPMGMISFKLILETPGSIVRIWIDFPDAAPPEARWIKYDDLTGWQDFSAHAVFSEDRRSVRVELQDGGFGDADGVANGIIIDPSGYGIAFQAHTEDDTSASSSTQVSVSSSGGGGGCFISGLWP